MITGCTGSEQRELYSVTLEDHSRGYNYPQNGHYYNYLFDGYQSNLGNILEYLHDKYNNGLVIEEAWFMDGSGMCASPGETVGETVIVPSRFIIKLSNENNDLLNQNFEQVVVPAPIMCGYLVTHYVLY